MATTKVILSGPIFDGQAAGAAADFKNELAGETAAIGRDWIKLDTGRMTRSGSDTGQAAEGVKMAGGNGSYIISGGISEGKYAWPWLEGDSKRNQSTGFKGYHTFRRTRMRMRKQIPVYAQTRIEEFLLRMGGGGA